METVDLSLDTAISSPYSDDLSILFAISQDLLFWIDSHGLIKKVSRFFLTESGYTESELFSKSFYDIIHPDDVDQVYQLMQIAQSHHTYFSSRCIFKNNHQEVLQWNLIKSASGYFFLSAFRKTKLELEKPESDSINISERRYKTLVQCGSELLSILNQKGSITYVSPTIKPALGHDPSYYIGKNAFDFVHPDDVNQLLDLFSKIDQNYKLELPHYRFIDSNGKWHWLEAVITNLLHDPDIQGILINAKDITNKKEIEEEKARLNRRVNNLIENNKDIFFTLSRDWTMMSFNSAMVKLIKGSSEKNLLNANLWELFPDWKDLCFYPEFKRSFQESKTVHFEEFSTQLNCWFDVMAYPYEDSLTVFIRDISELKIQQLTLSLEKEVLEMNASSKHTLKEIADYLLEGFEKIHYGLKASLSLTNKQGTHLYPFSIPSMPAIFEQVSMGLEINLLSHPCAQAAYHQKEIVIPDLESANQYPDFESFFRQYHLQTCHALPILNEDIRVLGTLAIFKVNRKQAINDENGLINRLSTIIRIILKNYQSKEDIRQSNERYRLTSAVTNDAIWDWNILSQEIYYGEGFKDFNHSETLEDNGIKKWEANLHPADAQRVKQSFWKALKQGSNNRWQEEYRYKKNDGSYALVINKGYIIRDENHQAIRMVGAMQDITAEKKSKQEILEQNQKLREIAYISSHEIRKPAANILGLVNLFDKQNLNNKLNAEIIGYLETTAQQLDKMIGRIVEKTGKEM